MNKNETGTQRKRRLEKEKQKRIEKSYNEQPEAKRVRLIKQKEIRKEKEKHESVEQKNYRLEKNRVYQSQYRSKETHEEYLIRLEDDRIRHSQYRAKETHEEYSIRLEDDRIRHSQLRATETHEECSIRLEEDRIRHSQLRASETHEECSIRLEQDQIRHSQLRATETHEETSIRLEQDRFRHSQLRATETHEETSIRLEQERIRQSQSRAVETQVECLSRMTQDRLHHRLIRSEETPEEYNARLLNDREHHSLVRSTETPEEHQARLEQDRLRHAEKNKQIEAFEKTINTFCDSICEICKKKCYPTQKTLHTLNDNNRLYLPPELSAKLNLLVCHRCKSHLSSKNTTHPPKAYWNNLNPGIIPDQIKALSQTEQRLLSRVIAFIKVVKFYGRFGQFGFRGQAILFAQDIFEVSENLLNVLPRTSNESGLIVVTEELENLNITREFSISRENVFNALYWLIGNNPLYKDVTINYDVRLNENDFIREPEHEQEQNNFVEEPIIEEPERNDSHYTIIGKETKILRASWHQGNQQVFSGEYAGVQCCAMALANIVRASFLSPAEWDMNTLNQNMIEGDNVYSTIRLLSNEEQNNIINNSNGYLYVQNFDVIKRDFLMFDKGFGIEYAQDTPIFGCLHDITNKKTIGVNLLDAMITLFENQDDRPIYGIFIAASKSLGLIKHSGKYYLTDSHSCGPKGAVAKNGTACVIECDTIKELVRVCKRVFRDKHVPYTIDKIDVTLRSENMQIEEYIDQRNSSNSHESNAPIRNENTLDEENLNNLGENDLILEQQPPQEEHNNFVEEPIIEEPERIDSHYNIIGKETRILRASWHQGNQQVFSGEYAGVQCCAMALANIVRASFLSPAEWDTNTLNQNMIEGDNVYSTIRLLSNEEQNNIINNIN